MEPKHTIVEDKRPTFYYFPIIEFSSQDIRIVLLGNPSLRTVLAIMKLVYGVIWRVIQGELVIK